GEYRQEVPLHPAEQTEDEADGPDGPPVEQHRVAVDLDLVGLEPLGGGRRGLGSCRHWNSHFAGCTVTPRGAPRRLCRRHFVIRKRAVNLQKETAADTPEVANRLVPARGVVKLLPERMRRGDAARSAGQLGPALGGLGEGNQA